MSTNFHFLIVLGATFFLNTPAIAQLNKKILDCVRSLELRSPQFIKGNLSPDFSLSISNRSNARYEYGVLVVTAVRDNIQGFYLYSERGTYFVPMLPHNRLISENLASPTHHGPNVKLDDENFRNYLFDVAMTFKLPGEEKEKLIFYSLNFPRELKDGKYLATMPRQKEGALTNAPRLFDQPTTVAINRVFKRVGLDMNDPKQRPLEITDSQTASAFQTELKKSIEFTLNVAKELLTPQDKEKLLGFEIKDEEDILKFKNYFVNSLSACKDAADDENKNRIDAAIQAVNDLKQPPNIIPEEETKKHGALPGK
jgi:hypothetical protein